MKTYLPKVDTNSKKWYLVDAEDKILGRVAVKIATILRGKHKPEYTPHLDTGDFVIVINAEKIRTTGKKETDKIYYHHTGYIGNLKEVPLERLRETKPEEIIGRAVEGMLPEGRLGRSMFSKLKVYAGSTHPHDAQKPVPLEV